MGIFKTF